MAAGTWFVKYRYLFYVVTFTLLGTSFYRTYWGKGKSMVNRRNRIVLWAVAGLSLTLTTLSIIKNLRTP